MKNKSLSAMIYALAAALFYALNVPCSKLLSGNIAPTFMAAFLYIGAGMGVGIMYLFLRPKENPSERLARKDMPFTIGMVVLDIIAPILLMINYVIALLIMIAGTVFAVSDTLTQRHAHEHSHTFTHTHNGETHTHTITHCHEHEHFSSDKNHSHKHSVAELDKLVLKH